jgi:hypothetical protein
MTDDQQTILEFAAQHELIEHRHIQALLKITPAEAGDRLAELARQGLTRHHRTHHQQPGHHQITSHGLATISSPLPVPRFETIRDYLHELGIAWLALAARYGAFGEVHQARARRAMHHHDQQPPAGEARYGTQITLDQNTTLHYPDLMITVPYLETTGRVAIQIQPHAPTPRRLKAEIAAHGNNPHLTAALYLAAEPSTAKTTRDIAASLELQDKIHVQPLRYDAGFPLTAAQ